jgi:hypothetical protein
MDYLKFFSVWQYFWIGKHESELRFYPLHYPLQSAAEALQTDVGRKRVANDEPRRQPWQPISMNRHVIVLNLGGAFEAGESFQER